VGPGVEDNHQGIVAVLLALRALIRAGLDLPPAVAWPWWPTRRPEAPSGWIS
jgi:hypothetical protein